MVGGFVNDCTIFLVNVSINNYHYFIEHYFVYKCTDEYRANIQMVKRGDTHQKLSFIPISKAHANKQYIVG